MRSPAPSVWPFSTTRTRIAAALLLSVLLHTGCAPRPDKRPAVDDRKVAPLTAAASHALREYGLGLAKVARETAAKADGFKSHAEIFDAVEKASGELHATAFKPLAVLEDQTVKPNAAYDALAIRNMLTEEAMGFERALGIKPQRSNPRWP